MDVLLDDQEALIQTAMADFFSAACPTSVVRSAQSDGHRMSQALWSEWARLGWLGLCVPQDAGGQGLPLTDLALMMEEAGRVIAPLPLQSTMVGAVVLSRFGSPTHHDLLERVALGQAILSYAVQDESGRWQPRPPSLQVLAEKDHLLISGSRYFVDAATSASHCLLAFDWDEKPCLAVVDMKSPGLRIEPLSALARDDQGLLRLDRLRLDFHSLLPDGRAALTLLMDLAAVLLACQIQGAARAALGMAVRYVNERQAFGQPIGAFQAIQHMAADMLNAVDGAQLLCREALWRLDQGLPASVEASQAKSFASERGLAVCRCAQQMHGGIGFIADFDIHLWYEAVASWALRGGTVHEHRQTIASALLDQAGEVRLDRSVSWS